VEEGHKQDKCIVSKEMMEHNVMIKLKKFKQGNVMKIHVSGD